MIKIFYILFSN